MNSPPPSALSSRRSPALEAPTFFLDEFLHDLEKWTAAVQGRDARHLLRSTTVDGQRAPLGMRAARWRLRYRRCELSESEIARLEAVPGWTWQPAWGRRERATEQLSKD